MPSGSEALAWKSSDGYWPVLVSKLGFRLYSWPLTTASLKKMMLLESFGFEFCKLFRLKAFCANDFQLLTGGFNISPPSQSKQSTQDSKKSFVLHGSTNPCSWAVRSQAAPARRESIDLSLLRQQHCYMKCFKWTLRKLCTTVNVLSRKMAPEYSPMVAVLCIIFLLKLRVRHKW